MACEPQDETAKKAFPFGSKPGGGVNVKGAPVTLLFPSPNSPFFTLTVYITDSPAFTTFAPRSWLISVIFKSAILTTTWVEIVSFSPRMNVQVSSDRSLPKLSPNICPLLLLLIPVLLVGGKWLLFRGVGAPDAGRSVSSQ